MNAEAYVFGTLIATRTLTLGANKKVTIRIGKPQRVKDEPHSYFCAYQIRGVGNDRMRRAGGVDAVQALQLVLEKIGIELHALRKSAGEPLQWDGAITDDDLGFPLRPEILAILKD